MPPVIEGIRVRPAHDTDAGAVAAIYNQGIEDRIATFETRPRATEDVAGWWHGSHPVVVAERGGEVLGFASASSYRARACYGSIAEFSVYVARYSRGERIGARLLEALIEAASQAGFHKLVSRIFVENAASRALARSAGFREVGVYVRHGQLDGVWRDVVIVERLLDERAPLY
ncbi:MAG: arsinothricin resistance N-acetyltransferase ArsN1 [Acidobacteriota bacterium]|nr:arsinothricin resistance N-acetyltransferase ArsN1 [Acidobacteriota bacterium]